MTKQIVADGISNEELGGLSRRFWELVRRVKEGTLGYTSAMDGLQQIIEGKAVTIPTFPTWKTITLGTHKNINFLRNALTAAGKKVSDWANDILGKTPLSKTVTEIDLVKVTVAELGFKEGAKYKDIIARARELGLDYCPAEVGPQLRLQYQDQPNGEWLRIAMEPIAVSSDDLSIFKVERSGGDSWLGWRSGNPEFFWFGSSIFVFTRRK